MNGLKRSGIARVVVSLVAMSMLIGGPAYSASTNNAANTASNSRSIIIGAKDLYYKKMNSAVSKSNGDFTDNMGLQFGIELTRNGKSKSVSTQEIFHSNDAIQFKVTSNIDGYMYVFLVSGSTGKRAQLYPPADEAGQNQIVKGITYTVPENGQLCFDENPGIETLQLALSPTPMDADQVLKMGSTRSVTIVPKGHTQPIAPSDTTLVAFENVDDAARQHFAKLGLNEAPAGSTTAITTDTSKPLTIDLVLQHIDPSKTPPTVTANAQQHSTNAIKVASNPGGRTVFPPTGPTNLTGPAKGAQQALAAAIQDKWALVVGISKHKDEKINLRYPHKDAQDFAKYLVNEAHFAPDHVRVLVNEQATKENILTEMGESFLPVNAKPGDLVVVFIAGHGTAARDDVAKENFLVTHDTDLNRLYATSINMNDFVRELKKRVKTDRVLLVLDTCHAGSAAEKDVDKNSLNKAGFFQPDSPIPQGTGQLVIASSTAAQKSHDSKRYENGIFTKHLIDGLRNHTDIGEAFKYTKAAVAAEASETFTGESQTPELKDGEWKGNKLILKAPPVKPRRIAGN